MVKKKSPQVYFHFLISSSSERTMDLVLEMCNTNSIHWCGVSGRQLGKLHPSSSLRLALTLLSSVQGLQVSQWHRFVIKYLFYKLSNSNNGSYIFFSFLECFWLKTYRHIFEENIRIWWYCTGLRRFFKSKTRKLKKSFISAVCFFWTNFLCFLQLNHIA